MRHDLSLASPDAHMRSCACRLCLQRKTGLAEDIRDTLRCAAAGAIVAIPAAATIVATHYWPAIEAAWAAAL